MDAQQCLGLLAGGDILLKGPVGSFEFGRSLCDLLLGGFIQSGIVYDNGRLLRKHAHQADFVFTENPCSPHITDNQCTNNVPL